MVEFVVQQHISPPPPRCRLHAPSTTVSNRGTDGYAFAGGHARAGCVVYDLVANRHPPATTDTVDTRLLQMTLQYLQETGQVGDEATVADLEGGAQEVEMEEAEWSYEYYTLHEEEEDGDDSVYETGNWCLVLDITD